jgi:hypothetical protein
LEQKEETKHQLAQSIDTGLFPKRPGVLGSTA